MSKAIRTHAKAFIAIIALIAVALGISAYLLKNQRFRFPWQESPYVVNAEFSTAQAVIAGQGQTVRVAGVRIGDIGDVELKDGRAVVRMDIDAEYKGMIRTDATALLRPKTGLKDMFVDLEPGSDDSPAAREGYTIPIEATEPDVNPDEVWAALDADTRDYLKLLVSDAGRGLDGQGMNLREVFRRFEPTHRDLALVNSKVAERRANLRRLITSLNKLNGELASRGDDLTGLVRSSQAVLAQFAAEESNVSGAVRELPGALRQTTDTLGRVQRFAEILGPTTQKLRPAVRALPAANAATAELARDVEPLLRKDIRPFVRESRPLVDDLRPAARNLADATPDLTGTFGTLNRFFNMLAFNPNGREGPENRDRQEGYLFWAAWVQHMALNLFSESDAHGIFRPTTIGSPCTTVRQLIEEQPELEFLRGLSPILTENAACDNASG